MYRCETCGYFCSNMMINSCQNPGCANYSKLDSLEHSKMPDDTSVLGFAVVPFQRFNKIFNMDEVLKTGTIFPELYMPYTCKIINRS